MEFSSFGEEWRYHGGESGSAHSQLDPCVGARYPRHSLPTLRAMTAPVERDHRERSRSQLHFKLGGTGNLSILAVNALAVNSVSEISRVFLTLSSGFVEF